MSGFLIAFALGVVILYVPGFMFAKAFRFQSAFGLALAPIFSIFCYEVLAITYQKLGVFSSFTSLFVPVLSFAVVALLISVVAAKVSKRSLAGIPFLAHANVGLLVLYAFVGVVVGAYFFLNAIGSADAFCQEWDNGFHLSAIRSFVDSGNYSTLAVNAYGASAQTPYETNAGSFYPAAWHLLCAMITSYTGATVTVAMNAVNFLASAVIFSSGMYCMLEKLFGENRRAVYSGVLVASAFTTFPWMFLSYGPIYPNLLSMSLLPVAMVVFMLLIDDGISAARRVLLAVVIVLCGFVLAVSQTNTIFAAIVLLWPYLSVRLFDIIGAKFLSNASQCKRKIVFYSIMALLLLLLWTVMYNMPVFQGLYETVWHSSTGEVQTLVNILTASYRSSTASLVLGALILVGGYAAYKSEEHAWLLCSYVAVCFMLLVAMATDGDFKQFLVGIWYTDQFRVAAIVSVAATPLACLGLSVLADKFIAFKENGGLQNRVLKPATITGLAVLAVVLGLYCPSFNLKGIANIETPFGAFASFISNEYADAYVDEGDITDDGKIKSTGKELVTYLDSKEQDFLDEVAEITNDDDALVVNSPFDGSVFAYGLDGINVLYRTMYSYDDSAQSSESELIKHHLDEVAWNTDVQEAVRSLDVEYVLLLDYLKDDTGLGMYSTFNKAHWDGIISINDNTLGFEVVLRQGDMRLYKITY